MTMVHPYPCYNKVYYNEITLCLAMDIYLNNNCLISLHFRVSINGYIP